jgi:hypothetical protein
VVDLSPKVRVLLLFGETPVDGADGMVEVFFDYKVKAGRVRDDGTIDFREINRFPQAGERQLLARLYEPTEGIPGADVYGMSIRPKPGKPYALTVGEGVTAVRSLDESRNRYYQDMLAQKPGVVLAEFAGNVQDARRVTRIAVMNQVEVGDVDFSTGNLGGRRQEVRCTADVIVNGDIRGPFLVMIDGKLEVKGCIEGESVDVSESLVAAYIRSAVHAGKTVQAGALMSAHVEAGESVVVHREIVHSRLKTKRVLIEPQGVREVLVGQVYIAAQSVVMEGVSLRNVIEIDLGGVLFSQRNRLREREENLSREVEAGGQGIRNAVGVLAEKLKMAQQAVDPEHKGGVASLRTLLEMILKGACTPDEARGHVKRWVESYGRHFYHLEKYTLNLVALYLKQDERLKEYQALKGQLDALVETMRGIAVSISGALFASGQLVIQCGGEKVTRRAKAGKEKEDISLSLSYVPGQGLVKNR